MPLNPITSFKAFFDSLQTVAHEDVAAKPLFSAQSREHFEAMRQHLLRYYADIEPVHSFKDDNGQVWDCIPVKQQPSIRASGKALAKPTTIPGEIKPAESKNLHRSMLSRGEKDDEGNDRSCPEGCIPLRRVTLEEISRFLTLDDFFRKAPLRKGAKPVASPLNIDPTQGHRWAHAAQSVANIGGHSFLNIWSPPVAADQYFSLSQHWYTAGQGNATQTLEAGWQVYPQKYNTNQPCLFIYWTRDYYQTTGAYNNEDRQFVQTGNQWALGEALPNSSAAGGQQTEIEIAWFLTGGNWWLYINGTAQENALGYYPATIYNGGPMGTAADEIDYGGEVCGATSWPPMGSGAFAALGAGQASYQRNILYYTVADTFDAQLTAVEDWPNCYTITTAQTQQWGEYFYYGGPGGNNC